MGAWGVVCVRVVSALLGWTFPCLSSCSSCSGAASRPSPARRSSQARRAALGDLPRSGASGLPDPQLDLMGGRVVCHWARFGLGRCSPAASLCRLPEVGPAGARPWVSAMMPDPELEGSIWAGLGRADPNSQILGWICRAACLELSPQRGIAVVALAGGARVAAGS